MKKSYNKQYKYISDFVSFRFLFCVRFVWFCFPKGWNETQYWKKKNYWMKYDNEVYVFSKRITVLIEGAINNSPPPQKQIFKKCIKGTC